MLFPLLIWLKHSPTKRYNHFTHCGSHLSASYSFPPCPFFGFFFCVSHFPSSPSFTISIFCRQFSSFTLFGKTWYLSTELRRMHSTRVGERESQDCEAVSKLRFLAKIDMAVLEICIRDREDPFIRVEPMQYLLIKIVKPCSLTYNSSRYMKICSLTHYVRSKPVIHHTGEPIDSPKWHQFLVLGHKKPSQRAPH